MAEESGRRRASSEVPAGTTAVGSGVSSNTSFSSDEGGKPTATGRWGIGISPWLWATRIRILVVIDGRITKGFGVEEFGLGPVLATLVDPWFAWWVRFAWTVRKRDPPESFRFTQAGLNLNDFDQVWFFGDWPGRDANPLNVGDEIIQLEKYFPLDNDELRILASWMERGGGVFATGDHAMLGASMCSRIPRVRKMRKWTRGQGVPSFDGPDRHETLVHDPQSTENDWEGDRWAQQVFPVYGHDPEAVGPSFEHNFPHPLLCGRTGVIERFPDHMHEGCVIEDEDVRLMDPLGIPGYDKEEFPVDSSGSRPRPHVVAHGFTTNPEAPPRRFGLIGVYDGDPVGIGRVVVDSTWHHWFSMNLAGFPTNAPLIYARMQDYYRNVGLWLSTPGQRASMLFAATWGALVGKQPEAFDKVMGIWGLGRAVLDVIGRTAPQCVVSQMVTGLLRTGGSSGSPGMSPSESGHVTRLRPPISMLNQAVVGGIALELVDLAHHHINERARGQPTALDADAIRRKGFDGVMAGVRTLTATLRESSGQLTTLCDHLEHTMERRELGKLPVSCEPLDDLPA